MKVQVTDVTYEAGSTIAIGYGTDEDGKQVRFAGDWRPMRDIAQALNIGEYVEVEVADWQLI